MSGEGLRDVVKQPLIVKMPRSTTFHRAVLLVWMQVTLPSIGSASEKAPQPDLASICLIPVVQEASAQLEFYPEQIELPPGSNLSFKMFIQSVNQLGASAFVIRVPFIDDALSLKLQEERLSKIKSMINSASHIPNAPIYLERVLLTVPPAYEHSTVPIFAERLEDHYQILPTNFGHRFLSEHLHACFEAFIAACVDSSVGIDRRVCNSTANELLKALKPAY